MHSAVESESSRSPSIRVIHKTNRSLFNTFLQKLVRPFRRWTSEPKYYPGASLALKPHKSVKAACHVTERKVADIYVYDVCSKLASASCKALKRIYYICGGSWQMPPHKMHWQSIAKLAELLPNTVISVISVPLAPEAPAPKTFPQLLDLYQILAQESANAKEKVIWAGDSSGANLVLTVVIEALRLFPTLVAPAALLCICPSTDLTRQNPEIKKMDRYDPLLTIPAINRSATLWAGGWERNDPKISPLFADVQLLAQNNVNVHGVTAGYDLLSPDGLRFRAKLQDAGVHGDWLQWDKQMHNFPLTWVYGIQEGKEAFEWVTTVLTEE